MRVELLRAKIHRARVTDANLDYVGSLSLCPRLVEAAGLYPYEKLAIYNVTNGERFETYLMPQDVAEGTVCINGAAAHLARKGDIVIIAAYASVEAPPSQAFKPRLVFVDQANKPVALHEVRA